MPFTTSAHDFAKKQLPSRPTIMSIIQVHTAIAGKAGQRYLDVDNDAYLQHIIQYVERALYEEHADIVALPELATSLQLEHKIEKTLRQLERDAFIIAGSYDANGRNRAPILCRIAGKNYRYYQEKCLPAPDETEEGQIPGLTRHIFFNTGIGDFAVLICYEASSTQEFQFLQGLVDFVIVIARNKARTTFANELLNACRRHYYYIAYANHIALHPSVPYHCAGNSAFFIPHANRNQCCCNQITGIQEGLTSYALDVPLLDQSRQLKQINHNQLPMMTPLADIQRESRYSPQSKRDKAYIAQMIAIKEKQSLPIDMLAYLEEYVDHKPQRRYGMRFSPFSMGLSSQSDLQLPEEYAKHKIISHHAKIYWDGSNFRLQGRGPTYIFQKKKDILLKDHQHILQDGEYFRLGKRYLFRLHYRRNYIHSISEYQTITGEVSSIAVMPPE